MNSFAVVGFGRLGSALGRSLAHAGWKFAGASTRGDTTANIESDVVFLTVPDDRIARVAVERAAQFRTGAAIVHCAGSLGIEVFDDLRASRADLAIGAFHPLQTVPLGAPVGVFQGAHAGIDADSHSTRTLLVAIAHALGMSTVDVSSTARAAYHAAAVVASNHVTALLGEVERLAAAASVPVSAFEPLANAAVHNTFSVGAAAALTGPVQRGDVKTVALHLSVLRGRDRELYLVLARAALELAVNPSEDMRRILGA
ncbi:MAG: DUF2520 domain-containing protein [Acidimicrobiia bacterium]